MLHNPMRRAKRLQRPLSRPPPLNMSEDPNGDANLADSVSADVDHHRRRHHPLARRPPDALVRGAVLVTLIVITFVLYVILWELERVSFASVSVPRPIQRLQSVSMAGSWRTSEMTAIQTRSPGVLSDRPTEVHRVGNTWPPLVTGVPNDHTTEDDTADADRQNTTDDHGTDAVSISAYDDMHCHGPCRFLFPVRIGEQESKARIHLAQILALALRLNRTVVLPNVGKGRMSACAKWSFDAYYDPSALAKVYRSDVLDSKVPLVMDLERFVNWIDQRPVLPSGFVVAMASRRHGPRTPVEEDDLPFIVDKGALDPKTSSCLESRLARLRASLPETTLSITLSSNALKTAPDVSTHLVQLLSNPLDMDMDDDTDSDFDVLAGTGYDSTPSRINASTPSPADVDILVVDYDLRHPLFATPSLHPSFHLYYTPAFYDLADRLADHLGPFVGVHWRMETVPVQNLAWCAAALVNTLRDLLEDDVRGKHVRHVWLATDHPRPLGALITDRGPDRPVEREDGTTLTNGGARKSSTFSVLASEHDNAIGMLVEAFQPGGDLDAWTLTDLAEQLRRYPYVEGRLDVNETLLDDPGVLGILDKLVIVQASTFVSGSTDCSKTSSFSTQVIETRQDAFDTERGKGALRNVVDYFGQW